MGTVFLTNRRNPRSCIPPFRTDPFNRATKEIGLEWGLHDYMRVRMRGPHLQSEKGITDDWN